MFLFVKSLTRRHRGTKAGAWFVKRAGYYIALVMLASFVFTACQEPEADSASLTGTWSDGWSEIIITNSTVIFENSYEGEIKNTPNLTAVNSVLIIKFTKYWDANYDNYPDVTYTLNTAKQGKYGALYWANLKSKSVNMSDAGTGGMDNYVHTMFDTFEEAQGEFTLDKAGNYAFLSGTPYAK